jgi:hypothetical protein
LPTGFLGMLVLVILIERSIALLKTDLQDPVTFGWGFSARAAVDEARTREILCLGDSLVKHGLLPQVLEEGTGRSAYNLAAAASAAPTTYFLLRRALQAGARPSVVLLDFKPSLLAGGPRYRVRQWQEFLAPGETLDLLRTTGRFEFALEILMGELVPSLRCRHEIRNGLNNRKLASRALNAMLNRNWSVNRGANLAAKNTGFAGGVTEAQHADMLSHRFSVHKLNADYASRTIALAEKAGARTYVVVPPLTKELRERREQTGVDARYRAFLHQLQDRHPRLTVLDAGHADYPPEAFVDPTHLNRDGTVSLSNSVGEFLRADLTLSQRSGRRWMNLSDYQAPRERPGLEDVEQTRAVIEQGETAAKGVRIP